MTATLPTEEMIKERQEQDAIDFYGLSTYVRPGTQALQPRRDPAAGGYDLEDEDDWPIGGLA
jgi:hypothetical protein